MASIVLLLGLSLVSLTQVETASSQYDQGMKVARANARLALQMAIGDLQEFTGPDQRVTATADGLRTDGSNPASTSFNLPPAGGVEQPFWTGVWDVDNSTNDPIWLVTRPVDATYTIDDNTDQDADPTATAGSGYGTSNELVRLVGVGSAKPEPTGGDQAIHDVWVPKEPLISDEIVGLAASEQATIGHYAYWVGDEGVKASYLIEDRLLDTLHDGYETIPGSGTPSAENTRLRQLLAHRYWFEVDSPAPPRKVDATNARIRSIVSDLVLRREVEGTPSGRSYMGMAAGTYTQNDVLRRFHDFTGMSRGLLVDTVRGGLKEDLSNIHIVDVGSSPSDDLVDDLVNSYLMPYLNVENIVAANSTDLTRTYGISPGDNTLPTPRISPVITEFQLNIFLSALDLQGSSSWPAYSDIYGQFNVVVELWNPYTSRINGADLRIQIDNPHLADLQLTYHDNGEPPFDIPITIGLSDVMDDANVFILDTSGTWWEPGEIRTFTGAYAAGASPGAGSLNLLPGIAPPVGSNYVIDDLELHPFQSLDSSYVSDRISLLAPAWTPEVSLRMSGGEVLHQSVLLGPSFYEMKSAPRSVVDPPQQHLSYRWELRNPDEFWPSYDPRSGTISSSLIMDDFEAPDPPGGYNPLSLGIGFKFPGAVSTWANIGDATGNLLGDDRGLGIESVENDIPLFEIPRQEFVSLGALQTAEFPSGLRSQLGASSSSISPAPSINEVFDRFFLSTVPQGSTTWTFADPLPNSRIEPVNGTGLTDLQAPDSAEHLYLRGAFNVNSTSVEAWTALLKGIRLETWVYDDPAGSTPVAGQSELLLTDENQFLRFSQSAEETWSPTGDPLYTPSTDLEFSRKFLREGLRSFTDAEIESLAAAIVEAIRTRRQESSGTVGPFVSLQDFIDSGVLETAIADAGLNSAIVIGGTPLVYASSYLTQQDILTAIAPYLTVRSDTFVVRAYGDAVNPFDDTEVLARAYCEAIVQRVHARHTSESSSDPMTATDNTAGAFGRNYEVISFRWLTGDDL